MNFDLDNPLTLGVMACRNLPELVRYLKSLGEVKAPVRFGVEKIAGKSWDSLRKSANAAAIALLNELQPGAALSDEQRQTLAGYTGNGGIGGTESEYYTPQPIAEGIWEALKLYGADTGNVLEPSAGVGVFHEAKPRGVLMTAAEIDTISGTINQLLHPGDSIAISPFEQLASSSPDNFFDHCVANVPFGNNRGAFANLDPAYAGEKNIGRYFVLRLLDKIKPGGYAGIIVPYGMTSGSDMKRLREEVSRKAEFLGAHRLPTGTFDASGTSTVVDIWMLRKHPEELADFIAQADEQLLQTANVMWPTYITGKWFEHEGKRFVHGEQEKAFRGITVKNGQVNNAAMKERLIHKFESRIDWSLLQVEPPAIMRAAEDESRFINRQWYRFRGGMWVLDDTQREKSLDPATYGAPTHEALSRLLSTEEGILSLSWAQIQAASTDYPQYFSQQTAGVLSWVKTQKPKHQERLFRGAMVGIRIQTYRGVLTTGHVSDEQLESLRQDLVSLVNGEMSKFGNPNQGMISKVSGNGAGPWFAFKSSIRHDGSHSDLLSGTINTEKGSSFNSTDYADTVRHLFSEVDLVPVSVEEFRKTFTGELPADDNDLLDILATQDGIAITPDGNIVPFDRATSGDIGLNNAALRGAISVMPEGPQRQNMLRQLQGIQDKRKWTDVDDIAFKLNSRWFDRTLILQFLQENGYTEFLYADRIETDENARLISDTNYHGRDGVFTGYRYGTIQGRDKETGLPVYKWGKRSAKDGDGFPAQLEKYLNGQKPAGVNGAAYMARIQGLEEQFNAWIRQHDEIDNLVADYNDAFNAFIPYEQSDAPLNLKGVSGNIESFGYQNKEVRRLSEDGRGILGFGTGLGKTLTALALEAYNFECGRSKRTAIVVPKSVLENWYHEAKNFYSPEAFASILFIGLDPVRGGDGAIAQVEMRNEAGAVITDPKTGAPKMRDALVEVDEATIKARMHAIPQSNYRSVVMTKEQYARIPLKEETVRDHAHDVLHQLVDAGRLTAVPENHREANKRNNVLAKNSDTGTTKEYDYPYFEDMGFDNVIADEGHNYRNSYSAGREAAQLAYLPLPSVAKSARDMAVKNAYLMAQNNGRGCVLLSATPVVNSPIDAFNMLSHVVSMQEWSRMGIHTPDDFVKVFGKTDRVLFQKISGEIEERDGLVGFQNLDGLRGIFHRWTTLKTSQDVAQDVKIPELDENIQPAPMTDEQAELYETLRVRAEKLSLGITDKYTVDEDGELVKPDSIFAIIRDMDRVCTDVDLYKRQITFRFPADSMAAVQQLCDDLPKSAGSDDDEDGYASSGRGVVTAKGDFCELVVPEVYEQAVLSRIAKFGIDETTISHPVPPKYSVLVENLREGLKRGKQIIFTDEKSQHSKLKRILCSALGMAAEQIGILNATTVADAGKKSKKVKAVKPPKELPEEPTEEQLATYYEQKQAYEAYISAQNEVSLGGLEQIAADYQEGRTQIIICNKKAEVGINLHKGTSDVHHLTLPWTPASIDQRNGRGARVGSTHDSVRVHYYCGKGSFDEFRLKTLRRKKDWIREILTSDKATADNADADSVLEMQLLLASNPEERERRIREQQEAIKAAALQAAKSRANINLVNYMKAQHAAASSSDREETILHDLNIELTKLNAEVEEARREMEEIQAKLAKEVAGENLSYKVRAFGERIRAANTYLTDKLKAQGAARRSVNLQQRRLNRISDAEKKIKQLRPVISDAIKNGLLDVDTDVIDHGASMLIVNGRTFKIGQFYPVSSGYRDRVYDDAVERAAYSRIISIDFDFQTATLVAVSDPNSITPHKRVINVLSLPQPVDLSPDEVSILTKISGGISITRVPELLTKADFYRYLGQGVLRLTDDKGLIWNGSQYQLETLSEQGYVSPSRARIIRSDAWYKANGAKIVYPDRDDDSLKNAIASWFRGAVAGDRSNSRSFMIALFGPQYTTAIESYGENASADQIALYVADWIKRVGDEIASRGGSATGESSKYVAFYRETGKYLSESEWENGRSYLRFEPPAQFSNQDAFERARIIAVNELISQSKNNTLAASRAQAQEELEEIRAAVTAGTIQQADSMARVLSGTSQVANVYALSFKRGAIDLRECFIDAVLAGLLRQDEITAADMERVFDTNPLIKKINETVSRLSAEDRQRVVDEWQLKAGTVTQEELEARRAEREEKEASRNDMDKRLSNLGITSRVNGSDIKLTYKRRNMGSFGPGKARGFFDPKGKEGQLFAAKDKLKEKFNAKFQGGGSEGSDFPGSWWLISTDFSLSDILDVIETA